MELIAKDDNNECLPWLPCYSKILKVGLAYSKL